MPIPRKGLHDIRARRTSGTTAMPVHSMYMRISCIEMEKSRRDIERRAAQRRIDSVDSRLADLEREKARLYAAIETEAPQAADIGGSFRIRY
ncbi:hypothetical protein [Burkholderia oklahomensis]|uniref:Uncharacterized protein n=1 Tax=Burkholderia oklahomensis TaxID=342113 RepID=A0AAI8BBW7_9BURK|nr:hypothetical protein [Burkholderia oklahomensis]AIO69388.1 hypothetical protein DM82_5912 [Burkholderia oklahomensis]AJX35023.1 hypothetical protein BG90_4725 [Burkholderia oklahomensis C6786]AOI38764.1 hypothetical protein WG70_03395 [Burkholderia oklahomensis EO147]AOI48462.1 hypothetical protein WI23_21570 [Burkholderia oklahomensis C6786]KUY52270.1 hypothetical protein WI23_25110 [Burkholderia oklahomensis C6786]